jgi:hypothetical protein
MFAFKSCPRCQGDVYRDREGELTCLQCGHELRQDELVALLSRSGARREQSHLQAA